MPFAGLYCPSACTGLLEGTVEACVKIPTGLRTGAHNRLCWRIFVGRGRACNNLPLTVYGVNPGPSWEGFSTSVPRDAHSYLASRNSSFWTSFCRCSQRVHLTYTVRPAERFFAVSRPNLTELLVSRPARTPTATVCTALQFFREGSYGHPNSFQSGAALLRVGGPNLPTRCLWSKLSCR